MPIEEVVIRELGRRRGLSEDEIKAMVEALKGDDGYSEKAQQFLALLGMSAEAMQKFPQGVQNVVAPLVTQAVLPVLDGRSSSTERLAERLAVIKTVLGGDSEKYVETLSKQLEELRKEFEEWRKSLSEREKEELLSTISTLSEQIEDLHKKLEELRKSPPGQQAQLVPPKDKLSLILEARDEIVKIVNALKELGWEVRREGEGKLDVETARKVLEELGYEVRRKGYSDEEVKALVERAKKRAYAKAKKELEIEKIKWETIGTALITIANEIFGPVIRERLGVIGSSELEKAIEERLKHAGKGTGPEGA